MGDSLKTPHSVSLKVLRYVNFFAATAILSLYCTTIAIQLLRDLKLRTGHRSCASRRNQLHV
jgi:hypothetical protein